MKRFFFVLALFAMTGLSLAAQQVIQLAVTPASSKAVRDYLVRSYEAIGCKVQLVELPAERARFQFNEGSIDALPFEREDVISTLLNPLKLGNDGKPWFTFATVAYIRAEDSSTLRTLADLKGKRIGFVRGLRLDSYVGTLGGTPVDTDTVDSVVKMLLVKRFDAAIASADALDEPIKQNKAEGLITVLSELVNEFKYYHVLSAKMEKLRPALQAELKRTYPEFRKIMGLR